MWFIVKITVNLNKGAYFCIDYALYIAGYVFSTHILKKVNCYKRVELWCCRVTLGKNSHITKEGLYSGNL